MKILIFMVTFTIAMFSFAQDVAPAVPVAQSTGAQIVLALNHANDAVPAALPSTVLAIVVFLIEMAMRFLPTSKPRSLFILIGSIFGLLGTIFTKLSGLLDNVVQKLKPDPTETVESPADKKSA